MGIWGNVELEDCNGGIMEYYVNNRPLLCNIYINHWYECWTAIQEFQA